MRAPEIDRELGQDLPDHLETHLRDWVEHDLISSGEADRIVAFEGQRGTARRLPAAAEVVGYLGAVLVLAAGFVIYGNRFEEMSRAVRVIVPAVASALAFGAGLPLVRSAEPTFRRLGAVVWTLSVALFAGALGVFVGDRDVVPAYGATLVAACSLVYASVLYGVIHHGALQAAMFASLIATVAAGIVWAAGDPDETSWPFAVAMLAIGLGWVVAGAFDRLVPRGEAVLLGSALALFAPTFLNGDSVGLSLVLGIVVAAGLLSVSTWLRSTPALVISGIGLFAYLVAAISTYLADSLGAPVALALSGLVLIGVALVVSRLRRFGGAGSQPQRPDPTSGNRI